VAASNGMEFACKGMMVGSERSLSDTVRWLCVRSAIASQPGSHARLDAALLLFLSG
jgi:hypothetical protein